MVLPRKLTNLVNPSPAWKTSGMAEEGSQSSTTRVPKQQRSKVSLFAWGYHRIYPSKFHLFRRFRKILRKISVKSGNMQQFTFGELNLRQKKKQKTYNQLVMFAWTCLGEDHCLQPRQKGQKREAPKSMLQNSITRIPSVVTSQNRLFSYSSSKSEYRNK